MVTRRVSLREATSNFDALVGTLDHTKEAVMVEDGGKVVAVVLSPAEFDELEWKRFFATVDQIQERNADKDPDQVLAAVTREVDDVRAEMYGRA